LNESTFPHNIGMFIDIKNRG